MYKITWSPNKCTQCEFNTYILLLVLVIGKNFILQKLTNSKSSPDSAPLYIHTKNLFIKATPQFNKSSLQTYAFKLVSVFEKLKISVKCEAK